MGFSQIRENRGSSQEFLWTRHSGVRRALGQLHPTRDILGLRKCPHSHSYVSSQPALALSSGGRDVRTPIELGEVVTLCCSSLLGAGPQTQGILEYRSSPVSHRLGQVSSLGGSHPEGAERPLGATRWQQSPAGTGTKARGTDFALLSQRPPAVPRPWQWQQGSSSLSKGPLVPRPWQWQEGSCAGSWPCFPGPLWSFLSSPLFFHTWGKGLRWLRGKHSRGLCRSEVRSVRRHMWPGWRTSVGCVCVWVWGGVCVCVANRNSGFQR